MCDHCRQGADSDNWQVDFLKRYLCDQEALFTSEPSPERAEEIKKTRMLIDQVEHGTEPEGVRP
jgi:hypothetical protein